MQINKGRNSTRVAFDRLGPLGQSRNVQRRKVCERLWRLSCLREQKANEIHQARRSNKKAGCECSEVLLTDGEGGDGQHGHVSRSLGNDATKLAHPLAKYPGVLLPQGHQLQRHGCGEKRMFGNGELMYYTVAALRTTTKKYAAYPVGDDIRYHLKTRVPLRCM